MPNADIEGTKKQLIDTYGFSEEEILLVSGKTGQGVDKLLEEIVIKIPGPKQEIEKLEKETSKRIFNKLMNTKENPLRYFTRLEGYNFYKLRVGDYRVIADIDLSLKLIEIRLIWHRKGAYSELRRRFG